MTIEPATAEDVSAIFAIKRRSLSPTLLGYSVFQAPAAIGYLGHVIRDPHRVVRVARVSKPVGGVQAAPNAPAAIGGYQMGVIVDGRYHLDYIATAPEVGGAGVGSALLADCESIARLRALDRVTLDVFRENAHARQWYLRRGYSAVARATSVVIDLAAVRSGVNVSPVAIPLEKAREEHERGFSMVILETGNRRIEVGIIGGTTARLMSPQLDCVVEDAHAVAAALPDRSRLLALGLEAAPTALPCLGVHEVDRLEKPV